MNKPKQKLVPWLWRRSRDWKDIQSDWLSIWPVQGSEKMKPPCLRLSYYAKCTQIGMELWLRMYFYSIRNSKSLIVNKSNQLFPMMVLKNPIHKQ